MALLAENIKFYQPQTWAEGDTHGGDINTAAEIPASGLNNVFDNVSDAERQAGDTDYRKIYIRNENDQDWTNVKAWIEQFTPATNDEIWITASGTNSDTTADASSYTFVQPSDISDANVQDLGTLAASGGYHHLWLKRVVDAGGAGYTNNSFIIKFAST